MIIFFDDYRLRVAEVIRDYGMRDRAGALRWRISIAAVERSGPFSDFSGFDRRIMLLKGNGMVLTIDPATGNRQAGETLRIDRSGDAAAADSITLRAIQLPCSLAVVSIVNIRAGE